MIKKFLPIIAVVLVLIAIPAGIFLTKRSQDNRGKAAVANGTAQFFLNAPTAIEIGTIAPVTISLQTPTTPSNKGITIIKATVTYSFTGANPLSLTADQIQFKLGSPWSLLKKDVITDANSATIVLEAAYLQAGDTGDISMVNQAIPFITMNMTAIAPGTINLSFDPARSYVKSKDRNLDILGLNSQTASITISGASSEDAGIGGVTEEEENASSENEDNTWIDEYDTSSEWSDDEEETLAAADEEATDSAEASASARNARPVRVTNLVANQRLTNTLPVLRGRASPFARIHILIESDPIEGDTTADANGNWTWTPEEPLPGGEHTLTVTATDQLGTETSTEIAFSVTDESGATALADAGITEVTFAVLVIGTGLLLAGIFTHFKRI